MAVASAAASLGQTPYDYLAALDRGVKGLRIAWSPDYRYASVDPEVAEIVSTAAQVKIGAGCWASQGWAEKMGSILWLVPTTAPA